MKSPINIPALDINSNTMMKPPFVCSVPSLMDIDPTAPFEFHFPCQDMEWDFSSDLGSSDPEEEYFGDSDLNVSFSSSLYQFLPDPVFTDEEDDMKDEMNDEEEQEMSDEENEMDGEEDDMDDEDEKNDVKDEKVDVKNELHDSSDRFINRILFAISHTCPTSRYKRRKNGMKRKRNRRKRKRMNIENVDPEFHSIFNNVGDLFVQSSTASIPPTSSLPKICVM